MPLAGPFRIKADDGVSAGGWSVEVWVRPGTVPGFMVDFASAASDYINRVAIGADDNGIFTETWISHTRAAGCTLTAPYKVPIDTWTHVVSVLRWLDDEGRSWQTEMHFNGTLRSKSPPPE